MRPDQRPTEPREIEVQEFTERKDFLAYRDAVEKVIRKAGPKGISTAGIHAKLGTTHQKWTLIAIRHIADIQESWAILPTRYSIQTRRIKRSRYGAIPAVR